MLARLKALLGKLGRIDKLFLILLAVYVPARLAWPGSLLELLLALVLYVVGFVVACRLARFGIRKLIWRLRNRLLVVYLFIAVVPVVLILTLAGIGAWILTGQIATYMVVTELDRRTTALLGPARLHVRGLLPPYRQRFPGLQLLSTNGGTWRDPPDASITAPPAGWGEAAGLMTKGGQLHLWAHAAQDGRETTLVAPMAPEAFSELVPGLAEVTILLEEETAARAAPARRASPTVNVSGRRFRMPEGARGAKERVPPPASRFDRQVTYLCPVPVALWEVPGRLETRVLIIQTRYSAVLRALFGQTVEFSPGFTMAALASFAFTAAAILFLIVEAVSLVIGTRLTRSITGAVHNLYEGTERVREGDFSHRIEVRGNDQLAELGHSFNRMTENLERLVEVAKEKERMQGELEIAREVQNQLYPKSLPVSRTIRLTAACHPARTVSGDYYDYLNLEEPKLALAIGDVAGKGISAALLMATVQSSMRAQLRAGREPAGGGPPTALSTATLVSRLNQQLHAYTSPEKFSTFYFAVYDDSTGLMTYTNAGHLPPMLVRGGEVSRLEVTGTIVGAFPFSQYEESTLQLEPGDLLVCFTDGITEPENEYGEMFGEDRLIELLLRHERSEGEAIIGAVMDSVHHWTGSPELQDDMTMLVARRL